MHGMLGTLALSLAATLAMAIAAAAQEKPSPDVLRDLAPTGKLRAAINYGNTVLAQKDEKTGALAGVTVVLARTLAERLGPSSVVVTLFPSAGTPEEQTRAAATGAVDSAAVLTRSAKS